MPAKLAELGVIPLDKGTAAIIEKIGVYAFFIVIGGFAIWVVGTFLKNIRVLKGQEA